jgi:DNA-binding winged helix-turn-helix (wHTH) protein/TolB-like protein/Tfp pilus assembly protein PilF
MDMSNAGAAVPPRLQIGQWRADRTTNELARGGETVRIEPKAMEVLMVLAGRAGQVVGREQLLDTVWSGVIVGDEALTQSIIKLRKALGDNPRAPSYIETISKRGYRLIAPVADAVPSVRERGIRFARLIAGIMLVLGVAGAYLVNSLLRPPDAARFDAGDGQDRGLLTVTVLPFETVGSGPEQGYLARGIGHDLMTDLSRLSGLRLITAYGPPDSRTANPARYVVSGSVQREATTLRINIRLIDSRSNEQLWSQRFERPFGDLFAIQNEISRRLTEELPGKITAAERERLAKRYTSSVEAYEYFLRGQALFLVRRTEENLQARAFYAKALELDPKFARAYAGLAMTHAMEYRYQMTPGSSAALARAFELAESARLIDPGIPEIYWALGFVQAQSRRHDEALKSLQKAIEMNRSYADAYALMGGVYTYVGEPAKSIPLLRTALRLNSGGGYLYFLLLGRAYLFENDIEQALINLREALARNPDNMETRMYLAAALVADGNVSAAEWEAEEIRARESTLSARGWLQTYPLTSTRHQERLLGLLAQAGL